MTPGGHFVTSELMAE